MRTFMLIVLVFLSAAVPVRSEDSVSVYVWEFATRDGERTSVTQSLTRELEEALVAQPHYRVVEGRAPDRLLDHRNNVKLLQGLIGASEQLLSDLKTYQVDQVVFGELFDDIDSGQYTLTVTFQGLDGAKALVKSVDISRGLIADRNSRKEKVRELVSAVGSRTKKILRVAKAGFIFDLQDCVMSERTINCHLSVVNNDEDRYLHIGRSEYGKPRGASRVYDDTSNETVVSSVQLANQVDSDNHSTYAFLVGGRTGTITMAFNDAPSSAAMITRLDLYCWESEDEQKFLVTFRNIPIAGS